ncbi:unnamed protein product [Ceutorhynchus assimilis]|uniref:LRRCT domain-containing protein n=1 Tax=Ceutorhynchus assimilis TaxID=467358 RepID=A0A9P0DKN8_9CUCU|nr:unnamed protein product [Ceutorhynchus assimilis]
MKIFGFALWFLFFAVSIQDDCFYENAQSLLCRKFLPTGTFPNVERLNVTQVKLEKLNFHYFQEAFPNLKSLTLIGGNVTQLKQIIMPQGPALEITVLHLSGLQITSFCDNFTNYFPNLKLLNVSGNYLSEFPKFSFENLTAVYLSENKWNCSKSLEWSLDLNKTVFKDLESLRCFKMPHSNKPILAIAKFRKITRETCTPNCTCQLIKCVTDMDSGVLEPIIEVDCSFRGFTEMPSTIPPKTKILRLEGNFIDDLSPLKTNFNYRGLLDLFLDNNIISNVNILEGSYWLTHFRYFSIRGNQISELPAYAIDNALQHNSNMPNAVRLILGENPWRCDCLFAPRFKTFLQKYASQVIDIKDIRCAKDSEHPLTPIIDLSRSSVCHSPSEYTIQEALDLLNGILAFLIVFVLSKLAYDYYYFKKTGRLPWIVTKLP